MAGDMNPAAMHMAETVPHTSLILAIPPPKPEAIVAMVFSSVPQIVEIFGKRYPFHLTICLL